MSDSLNGNLGLRGSNISKDVNQSIQSSQEFKSLAYKKIEVQDSDENERGTNHYGWGLLPDLILEKIFAYLTIRERYYASCVSKQWYHAFQIQKTWHNFTMTDTTLTRVRYDYGEKGWRHVLDHHRTQQWINHVGPLVRRLTFTPKSFAGLFSHYHFMNHVASYSERFITNPECSNCCLFKIQSLKFVFFCDISSGAPALDRYVIGTGGDILAAIKRLICSQRYLLRLELIDLLLVEEDAFALLEEAVSALSIQLRHLTLINLCKIPLGLRHVLWFSNLRALYISPQSLSDEIVSSLANCPYLRQLHLVQNAYGCEAPTIDPKAWFRVNHLFTVHLRTTSPSRDVQMVWQERANVNSVIFDSPFTKFSDVDVMTVIDLYSGSLREWGHLGMAKFRSSRRFVNRIDAPLLTLCRRCTHLHTLIVRDRISTSTALLIASMTPNLRHFHIRRNALLKKIDFQFHMNLVLDYNFSQWISLNAKSYERSGREISSLMGISSWRPLSDKDFKRICSQRPPY